MKKYLSFIVIAATMIFVSYSCSEDSLIRIPENYLSPANFSSEDDIVFALNGTYRAVLSSELLRIEFTTDNGFMDKSWAGMIDFWDQRHNSMSGLTETKWSRNYSGIIRANSILDNIDKVTVSSPELRERYRAEARFLRAFFYTDLVLHYGDVPLRLKVEGIEEQNKARAPKSEVIQVIKDDLDMAIPHLPYEYDLENRGRATRGAARTLAAWLALNEYDYETVINKCDSVIASGVYEIYPVYEDLFNSKTDATNKEIIFDMQYTDDARDQGLSDSWTGYFNAWGSYMGLLNLAEVFPALNGLPADSTNLLDSIANPGGFNPNNPFSNRDPRLNYIIMAPYTFNYYSTSANRDVYYIPYSMKGTNFTSIRIRKYVDFDVDPDLRSKTVTGTNIAYFRYPDVLLMKAEALCELYGATKESEITALVNQVRQRADVMMPKVEDVQGTGLTQEQLRNIIRRERRIEFAFEGKRRTDIQRWDIGEEAYSDGRGYDPSFLNKYQATNTIVQQMDEDGELPNSIMRYMKRESSDGGLLNKVYGTEEDYRARLAQILTPENGFDNNELDTYGDLIIWYVGPRYIPYTFRKRSFDTNKGYLWPIPFIELESNNLISNNPGYAN